VVVQRPRNKRKRDDLFWGDEERSSMLHLYFFVGGGRSAVCARAVLKVLAEQCCFYCIVYSNSIV